MSGTAPCAGGRPIGAPALAPPTALCYLQMARSARDGCLSLRPDLLLWVEGGTVEGSPDMDAAVN